VGGAGDGFPGDDCGLWSEVYLDTLGARLAVTASAGTGQVESLD
jgi:hypothetical protein